VNTKTLAKMYDVLTPFERLPLIIAASERGDDAEADRLARSAPRMDVRLPHYHGLGEGLLLLSLLHTIGQLELGLMYWHVSALAADWEEFEVDEKDRERAERMWACARMAAYRFCVQADAWKQLFGELKIDPEALLRDLPCHDTLHRMEELARLMAFTAEEATAQLRRHGPADTEAPTVEGAARAMRAFIDSRVKWWG
jgi:hypothetical protein